MKIYRSIVDLYSDRRDNADLILGYGGSFQAGKVQEEKNIAEQLKRIAGSLDKKPVMLLCSGSEDIVYIRDSPERMSDLSGSAIGDKKNPQCQEKAY